MWSLTLSVSNTVHLQWRFFWLGEGFSTTTTIMSSFCHENFSQGWAAIPEIYGTSKLSCISYVPDRYLCCQIWENLVFYGRVGKPFRNFQREPTQRVNKVILIWIRIWTCYLKISFYWSFAHLVKAWMSPWARCITLPNLVPDWRPKTFTVHIEYETTYPRLCYRTYSTMTQGFEVKMFFS